MRFLDKAKINLKAGNGGNGCVSFRREKFIEFGGPNGGNGGDGGNIYLAVDSSLNTLIDFRYKQHFKAQSGKHGKGKNLFGASAKDLILLVPNNTTVWNEDKSILIAELNNENPQILIAKGGKGGKGNTFFKSSTNQAPKYAEQGTKGEELWVWLELQLFADVGLIGLPNAGKSTLLSTVSKAKTKIANYPFSTTIPTLGTIKSNDFSFVMADIPGLIKGASQGKGLGYNFLAHITKCNILLHLIDANQEDYFKSFLTVNNELKLYSKELIKKQQIVLITKSDSVPLEELTKKLQSLQQKLKPQVKIITISAVNKSGISLLIETIINNINACKNSLEVTTKKIWTPL